MNRPIKIDAFAKPKVDPKLLQKTLIPEGHFPHYIKSINAWLMVKKGRDPIIAEKEYLIKLNYSRTKHESQ